jgi:tetratricopeptide (TPR) repeat protein
MRATASGQPTTDPELGRTGPIRLGLARTPSVRIGSGVAVVVFVLGAAAWFLTRFDPLGRAAAAYDRRQYRSALQSARDYLRWFPNDRRASLMGARCLTRLGRAAEAEGHYQQAGPLSRGDAHARAYGLINLNEPVRAALTYDELLRRWPEDVLALKRLAAVWMGLKRWRDVIKLADRLIAIPVEEVAGQTMAGIAHHESKHHEQAVIACLRVVELDPGLTRMPLPRTLFWSNLTLDLIALGRTDEARGYLTRALADSHDAGLMELLGLTYSQHGATDEAERCWRQAERWDPDNADVCLDLGRLALSRHRWSEAVGFLKRAADRSTDAVEPLYNLSQAYRMLGDAEEAERYRGLADQRRRARRAAATGMGAEADPDGARVGHRAGPPESDR